MAQATLKNQQKILRTNKAIGGKQVTIISNQNKILKNQARLLLILDNEVKILRNQDAIIKNQKKILAFLGKNKNFR